MQGDQRGRLLGFPTANLESRHYATGEVPDGVYAGWLRIADTLDSLPAAISLGWNPTFEGIESRRVEAHVIDRTDLALYGELVEVGIVAHLRDTVTFSSVQALVEQIHDDVDRVRRLVPFGDWQAPDEDF